MAKFQSSEPSRRQQRVVDELRRALATILNRDLPALDVKVASITITAIDLSPDLRHARVSLMPLGGEKASAVDLVKTLEGHVPLIRKELAQKVYLKYLPKLKFVADMGLDATRQLEDVFQSEKVQNDIKKTNSDE